MAAGREPPFLAPLPVELLEPSADTLATLRRWGVRTIGELEALPAGGVAVRLGAEGALLARVARGQADSPLLTRAPSRWCSRRASTSTGRSRTSSRSCSCCAGSLENLMARLGCRALASGDLGLTMKLSPRGRDVRTVPVAAPTRDVGTLLALVRLALETAPPAHAVEGIIVRTSPARARAAQLSFFEPAGPSPDKLASTIARLAALVGETRVGAPVLLDRHLPDAFTLQPFAAPRLPPSARDAVARRRRRRARWRCTRCARPSTPRRGSIAASCAIWPGRASAGRCSPPPARSACATAGGSCRSRATTTTSSSPTAPSIASSTIWRAIAGTSTAVTNDIRP